jgi:hypothetical protein
MRICDQQIFFFEVLFVASKNAPETPINKGEFFFIKKSLRQPQLALSQASLSQIS